MTSKFSSMKMSVTQDWQRQVPNFKLWKPKLLIRLHGPLLMGICLDSVRSPSSYQPFFFFQSLTTVESGVVLGLSGPLLSQRGSYEQVRLSKHLTDLELIAERFIRQYPLVRRERLTFNDYVQTAANALSGKHGAGRGGSLPLIYRDIVLLACYCGKLDHAKRELEAFFNDLKGRPDCDAPYIGGIDRWRSGLEEMLDQSKVTEVVSAEKAKFKLHELIDYGIEFGAPIRLFDIYKP